MGQRGPLRWLDGAGWLILVGSEDWRSGRTNAIDTHILTLANLDRPCLVLSDALPMAELEPFVDYLIGCGASLSTAYTLAESKAHHPDLLDDLADAGVLYLLSAQPLRLVRQLRYSPLLERITEGYSSEQGLIVVGYGHAAACFGARLWQGRQEEEGLNWLANTVIQPHYETQEEMLRAVARSHTGLLGLGLPSDTALALGPHHEVLTWGEGEITAVLHQHTPPADEPDPASLT